MNVQFNSIFSRYTIFKILGVWVMFTIFYICIIYTLHSPYQKLCILLPQYFKRECMELSVDALVISFHLIKHFLYISNWYLPRQTFDAFCNVIKRIYNNKSIKAIVKICPKVRFNWALEDFPISWEMWKNQIWGNPPDLEKCLFLFS